MTLMFKKILIANRGEIACRVAATARRMAIKTVAVYSDADASAKHVSFCDEAIHIGGSAPKDSYLRWAKIIEAAKATGAEAIHPGYGFLSENEEFAQACASAGLVFIGPPASAIKAMGLKAESKQLMEKAGVPLVPALLWAQSRRPQRSTASATAASTWPSSVTSAAKPTASPPSATMAAATASAPPRSMSTTTTRAPSVAKRRAVAAPMPPPAPVTSATSPSRK